MGVCRKWPALISLVIILSSQIQGESNEAEKEDFHIVRISHPELRPHPDLINRLDSTAGCEVLGYRDTNTEVGCRSKRHASFVEAELSKLGHTYVMTNEEERIRQQMASSDVSKGDDIQFDHSRYHSAEEITSFVRNLADEYPLYVRLSTANVTHQGRDILLMTIESPTKEKRNAVWIDGGLHAREWISPAATLYFVDKLVRQEFAQNFRDSPYTKVTWYIMPLANPDGYENSRRPGKRFWRKNMSPAPPGSNCPGVDLNRNVAFPPEAYGVGASHDPCSDVYQGIRGDSEPETNAVVNSIKEHSANLKSAIAIHSYGQKVLTSWGYTFDLPPDHQRLTTWGKNISQAMAKERNTRYEVGTASGGLYIAGGATDDYAKALGVDYVATIELGDTGRHGFVLPASEIVPTGRELYHAMRVVAQTAAIP